MAIFIPLVTKFDAKGLEGAQRALANFQNFAVDVGRVAAAALTAVGVASVREAAQFETTFAKIQGLVGLTTDEIAELQEAARRLGPQFGRSGNEAGEALFFITSSGLRGADAIDVLEASLKGAAVGLGDMSSIANAATAAMNTYGPSVISGTEAVDALAEAVRLGQFAPEELASSLGRVIPISSELGISLQETLGIIAGLTRGGLNASEAVTGVRGAFQAFLKPSGEANDMLEQFGMSAEGVRESIREKGFLATVVEMREAFGDNEDAITRVFGSIEGLNAVLALTGPNLQTNTDIIGQMTDGVGILDDAMAIVSETAQQKFDVAMATAKDSLIDIGGAILVDLLPYLDRFQTWVANNGETIETAFINIFGAVADFAESEAMANIATAFAEMWPDIEETVTQLGEMAGSLVPLLLDAVEQILPGLQDMASIIDDISFFIDEALTGFGAWGEETPGIVDWLVKQINPMERLKEQLRQIAEGLDAVRRAYERLTNGGFDLGTPARDVPLRGRRASGGPVAGGGSYLVGEMGPEIFTPASGGGSITPNDALGGSTYNITVNAGMGTNGAALGAQIVSAIKKFERTSGPVFASA
jgi:TP901 family phage tail tape measure protein